MHIINCINVYYIFMLSTKTRRFFRLDQKIDIHLTNVAIQKTAPDYDPEKVGTWNISSFGWFTYFFIT
jgi:hypothetical protein